LVLDDLLKTELIFAQTSNFTNIRHYVYDGNIYCTNNFPLDLLSNYGQWYIDARISDVDGRWSTYSGQPKAFEYVQADGTVPPVFGDIPTNDWTVTYVDSEELINWYMPAIYVYDGDPDTLWHSQYQGAEPPHPHEVRVDMGQIYSVNSFKHLPRNKPIPCNGCVKDYEFYLSLDGQNWGDPVSVGQMPSVSGEWTTVDFDAALARHWRFVAVSEHDGGLQTSVAELSLQGVLVQASLPSPVNITVTVED
jgi:hypothetical protein